MLRRGRLPAGARLSSFSGLSLRTLRARPRPGEAPPPAARLVAYVVSAGENRPGPAELRRFLAGRLPEYMVPSSFVALERLPLLPNGKLDRAALPAPVASASSAWTAPRTATEARLAEIWSEVLGRAGIGVHDNFFELGGDSILSIQIVSRARQAGLQLAVRDLFEHQSIAELSAVATSAVAQEAPQGPVSGPVPLTPIQHWFLEQCAPDFHHFNQAIVLRMAHPPDLGRLHLALGHLLDHHDALRLRLRRTPESWEQHNACWDGAVPLTGADLSELDEEAQRRAAAGLVAEAHASLNLADGPLVRAVAVNLGPRRGARLVVIAHHLAVDGVSWRILLEDLAQAYRQLAAGEAVVLPPKTTSFQQWARRLRDYAQSPAVQDQREHWLGLHDHGLPPLPLDRTQGTNTTATARTLTAWLSPAETRALLNEVPAAYHTEINDVLLCALALAFQAWTGQRALLVDLEGHGREDIAPDLDLSRTVGWFTTLYPVRLELPGVPGPGPALTAVKEQLRHVPQRGLGYGLLRHLHPDAALATRLQALPPRPISFNYLGQYDQLLAADAPFAWAHESAGPAHSPRGTRSHLLALNALITGGRLRLDLTYSDQRHRQATANSLLQAYMTALRTLITHCQTPGAGGHTPSDFPLAKKLDQDQLDRLRAGSDEIEDIYPLSPMQQGMLFHTLYDPTDALYFQQLSWAMQGELDVTAFQRAWAWVVERHPVLRSRVEWVGLEEPLQIVLRDITVPWEHHDCRMLAAADQQERWWDLVEADRRRGLDLSEAPIMRLALVELGEGSYRVLWSFHHLLLDAWSLSLVLNEVFAWYEAYCRGYDLSLVPSPPYRTYISWLFLQQDIEAEQFWRQRLQGFSAPTPLPDSSLPPAITAGGKVPSVNRRQTLLLSEANTAALEAVARQHQLTLSTLVQTGWALLLSQYANVDEVIFGVTVSGRPTEIKDVESMVGLFLNTLPVRVRIRPDLLLLQWLREIQAEFVEMRQYEHSSLPQIQSWSEMRAITPLFQSILVYESHSIEGLRAEHDRVVFQDVRSWSRTNYPLTAIAIPGVRLHLQVHCDSQRFDTRAAQNILVQWKTLLEAIATGLYQRVRDLPPLADPEYQSPVASAPPDWTGECIGPATVGVPPRDPTEEVVAGIWAQVLGLEEVGIHDDFFDLGGHSLLAIQIVARLRSVLGIELPLRRLFEARTVAGLARLVRDRQAPPVLPPIRAVPRHEGLPLSSAQQRLWFLDQLVPGNSFYNTSGAVELRGTLHYGALERALGEIVRRHESLRTTFPAVDGRPRQVIAPPPLLRLPAVVLDELPKPEQEAEVRRLATQAWRTPFDLARGPLLRTSLLQLGADHHVLLVSMHHIAGDAWSMGVLTRELGMLYEAFRLGQPSPLAELPIQYADYAAWQQQWLDGDILEAHLSYWRRQLSGSPPLLPLPTDRPRPTRQSFHGAYLAFALSPELSEALARLSRREGVTPFMTLLAAFEILLQRYSGLDDIPVGTGIANRGHVETERLIGCFVNMLVLRADLSGIPSFRALLARVRDVTLEAYDHQDLPFEKLVEDLQPERNLSHMPLFQVAFGVDNTPKHALELAGLHQAPLPFDYESVRFDLTLWIVEKAGNLHAYWTYSTDLFDAGTITRMHEHYQALLHSIVANPEAPIDMLDMQTQDEKEHIRQREESLQKSHLTKLLNVSRKSIKL